MFGIEEDQVKSFVIETREDKTRTKLKFTRPNAEATPTQWQVKIGDEKPVQASDGAIAFLMNLVTTAEADGQLEATPKQLKEYGLKTPRATLILTLTTGEKRELQLGEAGFDDQFVYAWVTPDSDLQPSPKPAKEKLESDSKESPDKVKESKEKSVKSTQITQAVQTIPKDFEYALIREENEWKYIEPSPSPSPKAEASPTPQGEETIPSPSP